MATGHQQLAGVATGKCLYCLASERRPGKQSLMPPARRAPQLELPPSWGEQKNLATGVVAHEGLPLGRLLVASGVLARPALEAALLTQRRTFLPLGRILRDEHGLSAEALGEALKRQRHVPRVFLRFFPVEQDALRMLDRRLCMEHELMAFELLGDLLCVAFATPLGRTLSMRIRLETGCEVAVFRAPWEDIQRTLRQHA
jgi:hypothetical protein